MIGGGDGIGCANEPKAKIMERPSIAQAASMAGYFRRIRLLAWMIKQAGSGRSLTLITGIADCCVRAARGRCRRTAENRDEIAPFIRSPRRPGEQLVGNSMPSALAVLRLRPTRTWSVLAQAGRPVSRP